MIGPDDSVAGRNYCRTADLKTGTGDEDEDDDEGTGTGDSGAEAGPRNSGAKTGPRDSGARFSSRDGSDSGGGPAGSLVQDPDDSMVIIVFLWRRQEEINCGLLIKTSSGGDVR